MIDLRLSTLTVTNKADRLGRDEPMLWTYFIEFSVATLNSHQFVVTTDPLAGKLAKAGKGDSVTIPASVGRYHRPSESKFKRARRRVFAVGVIAAAFDNDLRTQKQIKDGYAAGAKALNDVILEHFRTVGFVEPTPAQEEAMGAQVAAAVREAIIAAHGGLVAVLLLGGGKSLGSDKYFCKLFEDTIDEPVRLNFTAKKERATYRVDGRMQFTRDPAA